MKKIQKSEQTTPYFGKLKEAVPKEKIIRVLNDKFKRYMHLNIKETTESQQEYELGTEEQRGKLKWMPEEILALMDKKREYTHKDTSKYKEIHKKITKLIEEIKDSWMEKRCILL